MPDPIFSLKAINENLPDGYEEGMQLGMILWYVSPTLFCAERGHGTDARRALCGQPCRE